MLLLLTLQDVLRHIYAIHTICNTSCMALYRQTLSTEEREQHMVGDCVHCAGEMASVGCRCVLGFDRFMKFWIS